ncbi:MAG: DUF2281 domain-containing protein [Ardenticatenia bacterium]|nr:MAG: DUF2281 domain-containing protein [Ardenticatenia bacterium]
MVVDFIAFLRARYAKDHSSEEKTLPLPALQDEPFIGMWHDRTDMTDSSAWVRAARKREWS